MYLFQFRIMPKVFFFFFFFSYHAAISLGHVRDKIFLIFVIKGLAVYTVFGKNPDPFMFNYSLCPITGICINKSCLSTFFFQFYQKKLWQKCCKSPVMQPRRSHEILSVVDAPYKVHLEVGKYLILLPFILSLPPGSWSVWATFGFN